MKVIKIQKNRQFLYTCLFFFFPAFFLEWACVHASLENRLADEIKKFYHSTHVELLSSIQWVKSPLMDSDLQMTLLGDDGYGHIRFSVMADSEGNKGEGWVSASVWIAVKVAVRKIRMGESLTEDWFQTKPVNILLGQPREYRDIFYPEKEGVTGFEALQTLSEGQILTNSVIKKIPDIHRGDLVKIYLYSHGIVLRSSGKAEESGYIHSPIKVSTLKDQHLLLGQVKSKGVVEVHLSL